MNTILAVLMENLSVSIIPLKFWKIPETLLEVISELVTKLFEALL